MSCSSWEAGGCRWVNEVSYGSCGTCGGGCCGGGREISCSLLPTQVVAWGAGVMVLVVGAVEVGLVICSLWEDLEVFFWRCAGSLWAVAGVCRALVWWRALWFAASLVETTAWLNPLPQFLRAWELPLFVEQRLQTRLCHLWVACVCYLWASSLSGFVPDLLPWGEGNNAEGQKDSGDFHPLVALFGHCSAMSLCGRDALEPGQQPRNSGLAWCPWAAVVVPLPVRQQIPWG